MMTDDFDADFASVPDYARLYRSLGIQAVPAKEPREDKSWKRPALAKWRDLEGALAPDETFNSWYGAGGQHKARANVGLICGKASGGIFVIDLDTHKSSEASAWWQHCLDQRETAGELETATQTTGGGGKQLLFRAPADWSPPTCKTPAGVDIRGEGGFAVLPPSLHESGRQYAWDPGLEPWEIGIAEAPRWLCHEIDLLVEQYGGTRGLQIPSSGPVVRTATPQYAVNRFGAQIDGREDYMTRLVWARVVDERRQTPIKPGQKEIDQIAETLFVIYERNVRSRIADPSKTNEELLEREGRGLSLLRQKMHAAFHQWEGKVQLHAEAGPPEKPHGYESPRPSEPVAEQIKFDPETGEIFVEQAAPELEVLTLPEIRSLPDPNYLIDGLVIDNGLGFIYGPPGCGKTFVALGAALSIAYGAKTWWGRGIKKTGPIVYISSEGSSDMKFRIAAWEHANNVRNDETPFYLIRQGLNFLAAADVSKLLKAVAWVAKREGISPVLVVVDTVSRVIPGVDENLQKDVTLFIKACDMVREAFGATVVGVHHTSRAGNLRGSTVFDGAGDFLLGVEREEGSQFGQIVAKKIKSAQDGWRQDFELKTVKAGLGAESLVAVGAADAGPREAPTTSDGWPEKHICQQILDAIGDAWKDGKPWSSYPQSRRDGRYAPMLLSQWGVKAPMAQMMIETWLARDILAVEIRDAKSKTKGLKVIGRID
jgi:hypothetical protein